MYSYNPYYERYLAHYGVLGMHWGIRRYQPYTHGQKGIFKGLKKKKRADIKSLKKDLKAYKEAGDELAVAATKKAIKGVKKQYREDKRSVTEEFDKENLETYKNKIATEGSFEDVKKWKNKLSAEQLATATARLSTQQAFDDFENKKSWEKIDAFSKKVNTIANAGAAGINLLDQVNTLRNMYGSDSNVRKLSREATAEGALKRQKLMSELPVSDLISKNLASNKDIEKLNAYQKHKRDLEDEKARAINRQSNAIADQQEFKASQEKYKAFKEGIDWLNKRDERNSGKTTDSTDGSTQNQESTGNGAKGVKGTSTSDFRKTLSERLSSGRGTGTKEALDAYDRALKAGKSEAWAQAQANKSYYQNAKADYGAIPVSLAREGNYEKIIDHILTNPSKYTGTRSMKEAAEYATRTNFKLSKTPNTYAGASITLKNGENWKWDVSKNKYVKA